MPRSRTCSAFPSTPFATAPARRSTPSRRSRASCPAQPAHRRQTAAGKREHLVPSDRRDRPCPPRPRRQDSPRDTGHQLLQFPAQLQTRRRAAACGARCNRRGHRDPDHRWRRFPQSVERPDRLHRKRRNDYPKQHQHLHKREHLDNSHQADRRQADRPHLAGTQQQDGRLGRDPLRRFQACLLPRGRTPTAVEGFFYAVWLYNSPTSSAPLGKIPPVSSKGQAQGGALLPANAGDYREILLTRETNSHAAQPGPVVLSGAFSLGGH